VCCIVCYRDVGNLKKTADTKVESRKAPWVAWGQSVYPLCEDYGLKHLIREKGVVTERPTRRKPLR